MSDAIRANIDSREGFPADEQAEHEAPQGWDEIEGDDEPSQADLDEMCEYFEEMDLEDDYEDDGQPTEYEEYQDLYGGDDWDHGQYDEVY